MSREQERQEAYQNDLDASEDYERQMTRKALIEHIAAMMVAGETAEVIVDEIIAQITPKDDQECPVCGVCP